MNLKKLNELEKCPLLVFQNEFHVFVCKTNQIGSYSSSQNEIDIKVNWFHLMNSPKEPFNLNRNKYYSSSCICEEKKYSQIGIADMTAAFP